MRKTTLRIALPVLALLLAGGARAQQAPEPADLGNAVWSIRLYQLFGTREETLLKDCNTNLYAVFENGKFSHALGSSRNFNTSVQLVDKGDIQLDGNKISGALVLRYTPDQWVPRNHQCVLADVEFSGTLVPSQDKSGKAVKALEGTYKVVMHGSQSGPGPGVVKEGKLQGGVAAVETGWDDAALNALLTPVTVEGEPSEASIVLDIGYAGGKVTWGTVGTCWTKTGRTGRRVPFDVSKFELKTSGPVGRFTLPHRALDISCDPKEEAEVELAFTRVQGLAGARMDVTVKRDGQTLRTYAAYGKGTGHKAGGVVSPARPAPIWVHKLNLDPWWLPVKDFQPVQPGEHPRLLFRKGDVAALRKKAQTEEGKAILARLRLLLDGKNGDTFSTVFNQTPPDNHDKTPNMAPGAFTTWHGAGYGLLYQVTGEQKYADLGRQAVQACFDGKNDVDNRYCWHMPGTTMRAGSILSGVGLAYDLCYDGWPEDFRNKVALEIQNFDKPCAPGDGKPSKDRVDLRGLVTAGGYPPGSNHYGSYLGAGAAVLAILGDPGTNTELLNKYLAYAERHAVHMIFHGFGDHGAYPEGMHASRVSSNGGFLEFVTALRNAAGRDYSAAGPNVSGLTLRWIYESAMDLSLMHRGVYGGDTWESGGLSHDGEFPYGFATVPEKLKPGLRWFYDHSFREHGNRYGAGTYPHRAVYAFVYWPVDQQPVNPAEVLPRACADTIQGYFWHRKEWKDASDLIVTHCMDLGPGGYYDLTGGGKEERGCWLKGRGFHRVKFPAPLGTVTHYTPGADGSSIISAWTGGPAPAGLAVDFSGASGAEALLISVGPNLLNKLPKAEKKGDWSVTPLEVKAGALTFNLLALHTGAAPEAKVDGETVRIGGQTIRFDGQRLVLGVFKGD